MTEVWMNLYWCDIRCFFWLGCRSLQGLRDVFLHPLYWLSGELAHVTLLKWQLPVKQWSNHQVITGSLTKSNQYWYKEKKYIPKWKNTVLNWLLKLLFPIIDPKWHILLWYRWTKLTEQIQWRIYPETWIQLLDPVILSSIWSLSAPGCPEVPTVPETVPVQGRPQLPYNGWTHNQGTLQHKGQVFFSGSSFQPYFWPTFAPKPITQMRMRAHLSSLSHWPIDCVSQCRAIQKPVLLILYTDIVDIPRVEFHHAWWGVCCKEWLLIDLTCRLLPTAFCSLLNAESRSLH